MTPIREPVVNPKLDQMSGLQRAVESFRYILLYLEHWISPEGTIRNWVQTNCRLCAWLSIPSVIVMPVIGFILWQLAFWWSLFTGIVGKLILIVLLIVELKMIKR